MTREDGRVDDKQIVSAINLSIRVNNCCSTSQATVCSHLGGTDPVVGTTSSRSERKRLDIIPSSDVGSRNFPDDLRDLGNDLLKVLNASDDGLKIRLVL